MIRISPKHCTETGIAFALLFVLAGLFTGGGVWYKVAAAILFLDLAVPEVFRPFAFFWFNLSYWMGFVTSRILLSGIFIFLIVPVALIRKVRGKDRLMLKEFKKSTATAFAVRNIKFKADHLNRMY